MIVIQGLTKSVMTRDESFSAQRDLKIASCEESYIYIDAPVQSVAIVNCVNTTVFVAAAAKICTIEKCENVHVTVAANFLRVGNTVDSFIYYYGTHAPVLYGDNRAVTLAPNNANYNELTERLKRAKVPLSARSAANFAAPIVMAQSLNKTYQILPPKDFFSLILPSHLKPVHHSLVINL